MSKEIKRKRIPQEISDEKILKKKIKKELLKLSYCPSHFGAIYLVDTIYLIHKNDFFIKNLTKHIYPILCEKYHTNISAIKTDIFEAILQSYYNCDEELLNNYLQRKLLSKPYTKDIIQAVLDNIT